MSRSSLLLLFCGAIMVVGLVVMTGTAEVFAALAKAKPQFIVLSLLAFSMSLGIRARKWQLLLNETCTSEIGYRFFLPIYLYNNMISNFTPAKIGDFLGPLFFKKYINASIGAGVSVILVDRVVEIIFLTIGLLASGSYFAKHYLPDNKTLEFLLPSVLLFIAIIICIIASLFSHGLFLSLLERLERKNLPSIFSKWLQFCRNEGELFYIGLRQINKKTVFLALFPLTALAWLFDILTAYFMFCSVIPVDIIYLAMTFFINVGVSLVTFIPLGLGAGELSFYYILQMHGYDKSLIVFGILLARCLPLTLLIGSGLISHACMKTIRSKVNLDDTTTQRKPLKKNTKPEPVI